jgi:hypothetical protein
MKKKKKKNKGVVARLTVRSSPNISWRFGRGLLMLLGLGA